MLRYFVEKGDRSCGNDLKRQEKMDIYLGENVLGLLEDVDPNDADKMKVSQIENKSREILSTTE